MLSVRISGAHASATSPIVDTSGPPTAISRGVESGRNHLPGIRQEPVPQSGLSMRRIEFEGDIGQHVSSFAACDRRRVSPVPNSIDDAGQNVERPVGDIKSLDCSVWRYECVQQYCAMLKRPLRRVQNQEIRCELAVMPPCRVEREPHGGLTSGITPRPFANRIRGRWFPCSVIEANLPRKAHSGNLPSTSAAASIRCSSRHACKLTRGRADRGFKSRKG